VSGAVAGLGWITAFAALATVAVQRVTLLRRMALVAQAAHELRGPLGAALLGLHLSAAGAGVELALRRAALALADLDAAPHGRRAPALLAPLPVRALLAETAASFAPVAHGLGVRLELDPFPPRAWVHGDRLRLAQALGNLVANALEHGAGPVRIRALATPARIRIEVLDAGAGFATGDCGAAVGDGGVVGREASGDGTLEVVRAAAPHTGRHGHGLAVAARVAAAHGGWLVAGSGQGGHRVVLDLPRLDADSAAAAASGRSGLAAGRRR